MKFIIDLPGYNKLSGGIQRMIEFGEVISQYYPIQHHLPNDLFSVDRDVIITYSDNPRIKELCQEAKKHKTKVVVYQLSYGMCLERERKVVRHPYTIVCASTYHIVNKIESGIRTKKVINYIGHSQEKTLQRFYPEQTFRNDRKYDVAIMIHKSPAKKFQEAFEFCKSQGMKIVLFGNRGNQFDLTGAKEIIFNADYEQLRYVFSRTKKYLSLSETEGLNRVGIEAMLCGCKPYVVDGCEIYKNGKNCRIIKKPEEILADFRIMEYNDTKDDLKIHTWDRVLSRLGEIIDVEFKKNRSIENVNF